MSKGQLADRGGRGGWSVTELPEEAQDRDGQERGLEDGRVGDVRAPFCSDEALEIHTRSWAGDATLNTKRQEDNSTPGSVSGAEFYPVKARSSQ